MQTALSPLPRLHRAARGKTSGSNDVSNASWLPEVIPGLSSSCPSCTPRKRSLAYLPFEKVRPFQRAAPGKTSFLSHLSETNDSSQKVLTERVVPTAEGVCWGRGWHTAHGNSWSALPAGGCLIVTYSEAGFLEQECGKCALSPGGPRAGVLLSESKDGWRD